MDGLSKGCLYIKGLTTQEAKQCGKMGESVGVLLGNDVDDPG